jgi:putative membrane protein
MPHYWHMDGSWGWGLGMFFMTLTWILVIAGLALLIRELLRRGRSAGGATPVETPLDILKKRYARGEIEREEFEQKKQQLS